MNARGGTRGAEGSTTLVAAVLVLALSSLVIAAHWAEAVLAGARAQAVADLSALAAVGHPPGSAREVGSANHGQLMSERTDDGVVVVRVRTGSFSADAAATGCLPTGAGSGSTSRLDEDRGPVSCR